MTDIVKSKTRRNTGISSNTLECRRRKPEVLKGEKGDPGPKGDKGMSVRKVQQGQNATTTDVATSIKMAMSKEDKTKLDGLPTITFEKVGKCNDNRYCSIKKKKNQSILKHILPQLMGLNRIQLK